VAATAATLDVVPLRIEDGHVIHVNALISGKPVLMVLDTGATVSTLPVNVADDLVKGNLAKEAALTKMTTADGVEHSYRTIAINSLQLGDTPATTWKWW
jgi:predicted aspartyl protease